MKKRKTKSSPQASLIGCMVSLTILVWLVPALAQSQRYPTATEMRRLRDQFRQKIQSVENNAVRANYIRDSRTQKEKEARDSFVKAWSKVNPSVAPFLGTWQGEWVENIYPSNIRGRVCIIFLDEGYMGLDIGTVSNGKIRTNGYRVFFKEGRYLGRATVRNNQPAIDIDVPFNSPKLLEPPTHLQAVEGKVQVLQQFNSAGCTASLPNRG